MLTNCAYCNKEIKRERYRALKGNCYCNASCQMKYEYEHGIRDKKTIAMAAHEAVRQKSLKRFKEKPNMMISKRGYWVIYLPQIGWKKYHQYVWEQNYGKIPEGMVVHHINLDRLDNRIENLQMMPNKAHTKLHYKLRKIGKNGQLVKEE